MASTSASRSEGLIGRIRRTASNLYSDNQTLVTDIRKALNLMKEISVDLGRDNQSEMVNQLEDAVAEQLTDFKKLFGTEFEMVKASSSSNSQNHPLIHQFKQAVWNIHHAGQPMPGEEQKDIVMTSTESNIKNLKCPLTGKPITELTEPVHSLDCKHIDEKRAILDFIRSNHGNAKCPESGIQFYFILELLVLYSTLIPVHIFFYLLALRCCRQKKLLAIHCYPLRLRSSDR
ncbi:hypothetical protein REPUB_Repub05bG0068900 [Reevesia pubescens]